MEFYFASLMASKGEMRGAAQRAAEGQRARDIRENSMWRKHIFRSNCELRVYFSQVAELEIVGAIKKTNQDGFSFISCMSRLNEVPFAMS